MVLIYLFFSLLNSSLACDYLPPFAKGTSHRIIQGFNGKFSHRKPLQYGIDFEMPKGTLIYSSRAGKVTLLKMDSKKGGKDKSWLDFSNKIFIDHGDGTHSLYAHLKYNSQRVKLGQKITAGMPIARSGCTGWCDGPHLHFEVFKKDSPVRESLPFKFKGKLGCSVPEFGSQVSNQFSK